MTDSSRRRPGRRRGPCRGCVAAGALLAVLVAVAVAGEPPAPWEIQGYSQAPIGGGMERLPDTSRSADAPAPRPWQASPSQWSGRDRAPEFPRGDESGLRGQPNGPWDDDRGDSPFPADAYSPGKPADPGYNQDPGYVFRNDRAPSDPWRARQTPDSGTADPSAETYPGFRFRGDPAPDGSSWSSQPDGADYRYRPLTEGELNRRGRGSVWRSQEPATAPRRGVPRGRGSDRSLAPGPVYGFEPNPWQVR